MTKIATLLLLFATASLYAQELRVVSSDVSGITVEYRPSPRVVPVGPAGVFYDFEGAVPPGIERAGAPDLRWRSEVLALPSDQGHVVTLLQADFREEETRRIAARPMYRRSGQDEAVPVYAEGEEYDAAEYLPRNPVQLTDLGRAGTHILGNLRLYPVQWNPSTGKVRQYTRMLVRVDFASSSLPMQRGVPHPLALNAESATTLTIQRRPALNKPRGLPSAGPWYRIAIAETGIYRFTRQWFIDAGIDVDALDPRRIRLFSNGGAELSTVLNARDIEGVREVALDVFGGDDGRFDANDYVTFFAEGASGVRFNDAARRWEHFINRYSGESSYILTVNGEAGLRMNDAPSTNQPGAWQPQWFDGIEFVEDEVVNIMESGKNWVGKRLLPGAGSSASITYTRKLHGLVREQALRYRVSLVSTSEVSNQFTLQLGGEILGRVIMGTVDLSNPAGAAAAASGARDFVGSGQLPDDRSTLSLTYSSSNPERTIGGYVDWVEWHYARRFEPVNDALYFRAKDTAAVIDFVLNGFTMSDVTIYDVTDPVEVRKVSGAAISGGTVRFQHNGEAGAPRQYFAAAAPAIRAAPQPALLPASAIRDAQGGAFVIITDEAFLDAARRLESHREREGEDRIGTEVVTTQQIYNEFGGSIKDPTSLRNFLAYAFSHWPVPPRYVLLFGGGHYDYRNYTTQETNFIPAWESENSINKIYSYASDDYYAMVADGPSGPDARVDLALGRITVQSAEEAAAVVDKIIRYETAPEFAPWKNRITLVADDHITPTSDTETMHTDQTEQIAASLPQELEQRKIYLVSFRPENTAQGRRLPDANAAIIDQINRGTLVVNYTGHGSYDVWSHERVFLSEASIPQLVNSDRLTFVTAATCTFGLYDRPGIRSGTELMILKRDGGAIGGLSAPRVVYSGENDVFNQEFFRHLLNNGREASGRARRLGEAIYSTKQRLNNTAGYEKFHLFADPSGRLALPRYQAEITSIAINGEVSQADTVQLKAFSKVTVNGRVMDTTGGAWSDFDGLLEMSLFDADRVVPISQPTWTSSYKTQGGLLYRGQASITDGLFSVQFIVPKDISYEGNTGRLAMYFDDDARDGAGFSVKLRVGGSDSSAIADDEGPEIQLYMDSRNFHAGDMVNESSLLLADLYDDNGINTTGVGIGHDIEMWLDGEERGTVLNEFYKGDVDSFQSGTVEFRVNSLAPGQHSLKLRAWDIYNNASSSETFFTVSNSNELTLGSVFNYPNPMTDNTVFTFQHNLSDAVHVEIRLYTLAGRLVHSLEEMNVADRFVRIPWDGRDPDGNTMANGTYFYKVTCRSIDGGRVSEAIGKLSILK